MDILGIDIGTVSVKYVRWKGSKDKGKVLSKSIYPYKGELDDLRMILADIKAKEGTDVHVAIGITSQDIIKRTFTIPILPKDELAEALAWSASKVAPDPLDEMVYDYAMLGEVLERDVRRQEALFVGARKEYTKGLIDVFEGVGFSKFLFLSDIAFAYAPVVDKATDSSVAVIDIGGRQTSIYLYSGKKLMFARELMTASESFTDALMSGLNLSYDEAETYKQEKGFNEESRQILTVPLERLIGEMQRTFNVFGQRYPDKPLAKVFVTGRGARIPNVLPFIKEAFPEDVQPLSYTASSMELEDEYVPAFALCAYRDSFVNLLPAELKQRARQGALTKWVRVGTVAVCAVLVVISMDMWSRLSKTTGNVEMEKKVVAQKKEQLQGFRTSVSKQPHYAEILAVSGELRKKDVTFVTLLKLISANFPRDAYLAEIGFDKYSRQETSQRERDLEQRGLISVKEVVTGAIKETITGKPASAPGSEGQTPPAKETEKEQKEYSVTLKGYVFGDPELSEPVFLGVIVKLENSGLIKDIQVVNKQPIEIQGRKAMQFNLRMRCLPYEI